jgi:hypothetical protein
LKAEAHDRIIAQNNPVNLIDPYGLDAASATAGRITFGQAARVGVSTAARVVGAAFAIGVDLVLPNNAGDPSDMRPIPPYLEAKGGKQNVGDTGLAHLPDAEISRRARDKTLSPGERRRYQKEEKARRMRNKRKRCQ